MSDDRVLAKKSDITFFGDIVRSKKGITTSLSLEQVKEGVAELKGTTDEWNGDYSEDGENLVVPSGTLDITENGEYDVVDKEFVNVAVNGGPEWEGDYSEDGELPKPEGTINITTMDVVDVTNYASAQVKDNNLTPENIMKDVNILGVIGIAESGITPSGTLDIEENGTYDVTDKANVNVNVEGIVPSGTLEITENGEYDVTEKANVNVNVAGSGGGLTIKDLFDIKKKCYYEFYDLSLTTEELNSILKYDDTSNVTNMLGMFYSCSKLTTIPQIDTSKVTNMSNMFENCSKLATIPLLNTSNVTSMKDMFHNCGSLTTMPQIDTSKVTNMSYMFYDCDSLTSIPELNTSNVTSMSDMFEYCSKLTHIPKLDLSNVKSTSNMFYYCTNLTSVFLYNIKVNLTVGSGTTYGHLLTVDSLVGLCKECIKQSSSRTLTVGTANIEKLSTVTVKFTDPTIVPSETAIPTGEKGDVVVCESTDEGAIYISEYMSLKNWVLA